MSTSRTSGATWRRPAPRKRGDAEHAWVGCSLPVPVCVPCTRQLEVLADYRSRERSAQVDILRKALWYIAWSWLAPLLHTRSSHSILSHAGSLTHVISSTARRLGSADTVVRSVLNCGRALPRLRGEMSV